ncbi:MAG: Trp family transcriptional regulator, partial [Pseudoxanthomonas sp.]
MKRRPAANDQAASASLQALSRALASLAKAEDVRAFLQDLCTPAELEAMVDRWR